MNSNSLQPWSVAKPIREFLHGVEVVDPFRWLEDQNSPATRSFIRTEQDAYKVYLRKHCELRASIELRVRELLTVERMDLPIPDNRGGLLYLKRKPEEEQKAIYHLDGSDVETLLLSGQALGRNTFTSLSLVQVSPDGRYLVFAIRTGGEDVQEIGIYDLDLRCVLLDRLPSGFFRGLVFEANGTGFYYVHDEIEGRFQTRRSVRHHIFGQEQRADDEVFCGGDDPSLRLILQGSEDGSRLGYTIVSLESQPRTRFLLHSNPPSQQPNQIVDISGASFRARFGKFGIEAVTTLDAPLGRIVSICPERSEPSAWVDIVPQTGDVIYGFDHCNDSTVVHYLDGRFTTTRVYSGSGKPVREIFYPQDGTVTLGQVDQKHNRLFYSYSNFTTPTAIYTVDLASGESVYWWQPGASRRQVEPQIESHTFTAKDGVPVAISLVRPKGTVGPHSLLLSAYGGGAVSSTPKFSALLTILLEAGFSFATAHVRGGGEGGQQWHIAAQRQRKQISVDDLIGAAEWLIDNRHSTPQNLGVAGQSNGALLTLCAIVQRPQLFRAALAIGPIADLTRFHLFGVARGFVTELGSPDNPEEFAALYRLSPYHGICRETRYPAALVISGDCDKRCDSLHARKMIAQLRETASSQDRILLDYTEHRGHKPVLPLTERIRSLADRLTFLIAELSDLGREERSA